jgi:diaminohydroxyphosphoribosylaminopyrimidine deaminase/5-amino-6-(5-phosphoribosylamino)uracil reductase
MAIASEGSRPSVTALLDELGKRRMTNVLVEGGSEILGSFLDARMIDEVHVHVAPLLIGGREARQVSGGEGFVQLADCLRLKEWVWEEVEGDLVLNGRLAGSEP